MNYWNLIANKKNAQNKSVASVSTKTKRKYVSNVKARQTPESALNKCGFKANSKNFAFSHSSLWTRAKDNTSLLFYIKDDTTYYQVSRDGKIALVSIEETLAILKMLQKFDKERRGQK